MEEEDILQSLNDEVEAMTSSGEVDLDNIAADAEMSLGEEDDEAMDSEFLNKYESTFNFIDSELDALRTSISDIEPSSSAEQGDKKDAADDSSYSSSSDRSPFVMPVIDEMALNINMGLDSELESEGEEEMEMETNKNEAYQEFKMEQDQDTTEMKSEPVAEMESTEDNETQVESSLDVTAQSSVELDPSKKQLETKPQEQEEPQAKFEARPHQETKQQQPSSSHHHSFHLFTTLISIALAFLTGQRFPKQDPLRHSPALEMPPDMSVLMQPQQDFEAFDDSLSHLNNTFEDVLLFSGPEYMCEREQDFSFTTLFDETPQPIEDVHPPEAVESLFGEKAAHAAAIHEALQEHNNMDSSSWEERPHDVVDHCINLHFGIAQYDGFFISMEMMQFIEPQCLL
mmetsp:Transcript_46399/g.112479  ORF Transcript_46399/g.112479 Transcript_46399/m.112479 type:complete len:400 (-) Transcript_46399:1229-2428(-)